MKTLMVEYAYPSSDHAVQFNCGSAGCWIILVGEGDMAWPRQEVIYGGQTEYIAVNKAYLLSHPFSPYWLNIKNKCNVA